MVCGYCIRRGVSCRTRQPVRFVRKSDRSAASDRNLGAFVVVGARRRATWAGRGRRRMVRPLSSWTHCSDVRVGTRVANLHVLGVDHKSARLRQSAARGSRPSDVLDNRNCSFGDHLRHSVRRRLLWKARAEKDEQLTRKLTNFPSQRDKGRHSREAELTDLGRKSNR
jgi:hypothetical protein